jgi:hypothetical protein
MLESYIQVLSSTKLRTWVGGLHALQKSWMIEGGLDGYAVTAVELGCRIVLWLALL